MGRIILFITFSFAFLLQQQSINAQTLCTLPPPQQVQITTITPTSLFLTWTDVPGAVLYRVSLYDVTAQMSLPDNYSSTASFELEELNTTTHEYQIGVSATSCLVGSHFGQEVFISYKPGIIIITDKILQLGCSDLGAPRQTGVGTAEYFMPLNYSDNPEIQAVRLEITYNDSEYADFLIWSDCYQQTRFYQISSDGLKRKDAGNTIRYHFLSNLEIFFNIINGTCDDNACRFKIEYKKPCTVREGTCTLMSLPNSCGEKNDMNGNVMRRIDNGYPAHSFDSEPAATIKTSPNPFNDVIQVEYQIQQPSEVALELLDLNGKRVQQLLPVQWQEAGSYFQSLPVLENLPTGMYILVTQIGSERKISKLTKL